ncbi:hypothetical protein OY671_013013, partial [Metschnikowia pulcherrima]
QRPCGPLRPPGDRPGNFRRTGAPGPCHRPRESAPPPLPAGPLDGRGRGRAAPGASGGRHPLCRRGVGHADVRAHCGTARQPASDRPAPAPVVPQRRVWAALQRAVAVHEAGARRRLCRRPGRVRSLARPGHGDADAQRGTPPHA